MRGKLLKETSTAWFSPLLDVIMNAFCAMAIIVFVLAMMIRPPPEPLHLIANQTVDSNEIESENTLSDSLRAARLRSGFSQTAQFMGVPQSRPSSDNFGAGAGAKVEGAMATARKDSLIRLPPAIVGIQYKHVFAVAGGLTERSFKVEGRPGWLQLHAESGTVYGIPEWPNGVPPTNSILYQLKVSVADRNNNDAKNAELELFPGAVPSSEQDRKLQIVRQTEVLPNARVGSDYEEVLGVLGGVAPRKLTLKEGTLPKNLHIDESSGRIHGTPIEQGEFSFKIQATHGAGEFEYKGQRFLWSGGTNEAQYRLRVLRKITPDLVLPEGRVGEPYVGGLLVDGFTSEERIEWTMPDLFLRASGSLICGTPSKPGVHPVSFRVVRGEEEVVSGTSNLVILPRRPNVESPSVTFQAWVDKEFSYAIPVLGMHEPVTVEPIGQLPSWLKVENGALTGNSPGQAFLTVPYQVTDARNHTITNELFLRVGPKYKRLQLSVLSTNVVPIGYRFDWRADATGGEGSYAWNYTGSKPQGLDFAGGTLTGTLTNRTVWQATISVKDLITNEEDSKQIVFVSVPPDESVPRITTDSLPVLVAGQAVDFAFSAEGGVRNYTWRFEGELPPKLQWTRSGFAGVLDSSVSGKWPITTSVLDQFGQWSPKRTYDLTTYPAWPNFALLTTQTARFRTKVNGSLSLTPVNAIGQVRWEALEIPPGMLFTNGVLFGTPTQEGNFALTVIAEDQLRQRSTQRVSLIVGRAEDE